MDDGILDDGLGVAEVAWQEEGTDAGEGPVAPDEGAQETHGELGDGTIDTPTATPLDTTGLALPPFDAADMTPDSGDAGTEGDTAAYDATTDDTLVTTPDEQTVTRTVAVAAYITDFSAENLSALEQAGGYPVAVYDDGTEQRVAWSQVHDPTDPATVATSEAAAVANATAQHVWHNADGAAANGGAGLHVTDETRDAWLQAVANGFSDLDESTKPYHNILINSLGMLLRSGLESLVSLTRSVVTFYDGDGNVVASFGADGVRLSASKPQYIGGEHAYIAYYDGDGDGSPDSIRIGGSNVSIGGSPLSQVLADVAQASTDAADALDSATLAITSTNGLLFKHGAESTVLQVAVFPNGGGRLDTIEQVRSRFGSGARIEWRWKHDDGTWGTMLSDDPHISNGGMWLTVTPTDVATRTSFEASLAV